MSSIYYVGTFEKNENGVYTINKPIYLTGIDNSFLVDLFKLSHINVYEDFSACATSDAFYPLFYTIDKEWTGPLNDKYEECYIEGIDMEEIPDENYPLICDGIERNGLKIYIKTENIKENNYSMFENLNLSKEKAISIISTNMFFKNNHDDYIINETIDNYNTIAQWINSGKNIYWYKYS